MPTKSTTQADAFEIGDAVNVDSWRFQCKGSGTVRSRQIVDNPQPGDMPVSYEVHGEFVWGETGEPIERIMHLHPSEMHLCGESGTAKRVRQAWLVTLSHPVSINRAYKSGRNAATGKLNFYSTAAYKQWKDASWAKCKAAGWPKLPPDTKLAVEYTIYGGKFDLDAGVKGLIDAVVGHALGVNDENVVELHGYKRMDDGDPRMDVAVWAV